MMSSDSLQDPGTPEQLAGSRCFDSYFFDLAPGYQSKVSPTHPSLQHEKPAQHGLRQGRRPRRCTIRVLSRHGVPWVPLAWWALLLTAADLFVRGLGSTMKITSESVKCGQNLEALRVCTSKHIDLPGCSCAEPVAALGDCRALSHSSKRSIPPPGRLRAGDVCFVFSKVKSYLRTCGASSWIRAASFQRFKSHERPWRTLGCRGFYKPSTHKRGCVRRSSLVSAVFGSAGAYRTLSFDERNEIKSASTGWSVTGSPNKEPPLQRPHAKRSCPGISRVSELRTDLVQSESLICHPCKATLPYITDYGLVATQVKLGRI